MAASILVLLFRVYYEETSSLNEFLRVFPSDVVHKLFVFDWHFGFCGELNIRTCSFHVRFPSCPIFVSKQSREFPNSCYLTFHLKRGLNSTTKLCQSDPVSILGQGVRQDYNYQMAWQGNQEKQSHRHPFASAPTRKNVFRHLILSVGPRMIPQSLII